MAPKKTPGKSSKTSTTNKAPKIDPNSSFTPESFEQELKNLAAKAKDETWAKFLADQASVHLRAAALLALIAVYANVSELALSPVYGSIPVSIWHNKLVMAACFVGWSSNLYLARAVPFRLKYLLPVIALYIPMAQFFLFQLSGTLTAYHGPLITETLTLFPLMVVSVACTATYLDGADLSALPAFIRDAAPGMGSYGFYKLAESASARLLARHVGRSFLGTRVGLEVALGASYALLAPSRLLALALPALAHTALYNTHALTPLATRSLNGTLASRGWVLRDRRESLTGYLSVLDSVRDGFRVMRCDHSLLGGEWTRFEGPRVAEPIYGVFTMLEGVRLVQVPEPVPDDEAKALVIGLGIGTLPAALVAHGIDTTVVEIDPVVHELAARYFRLPSNHTPVVADAVAYAAGLAGEAGAEGGRFDYIVHDVFTGGAEPVGLFTLEFLRDLAALLRPNGVIAINYAGDFTLPPPKIVVQTIRAVFPACRVFRENARDADEVEREGRDFTNMVIFCVKEKFTPAGAGGGGGLAFREARAADMLQSRTREAFLVPRHEVFEADFLGGGEAAGLLRANDTAGLARWQEKSALGHWEVMRTVVPGFVWESW